MQDLDAVVKIAKERGIGTVMDNTYSTPICQNPLLHGIDIVCHSATKYMGGHSDLLGGAVVSCSRQIITEIADTERTLIGANMDPHQASMLTRGLRTLPVRMKQHGENGRKIAAFLENHPKVEKVYYPGSATYGYRDRFEKYMTGTNGLMSIDLVGDAETAKKFVNRLHYFQNGCSWGGFESLAIFIGSESGKLVRIHVGLKNCDTLIADLSQALEQL